MGYPKFGYIVGNSLTAIYTLLQVNEFQNGTDNFEETIRSTIDILSSYISWGLYSRKYEEWHSGIWHHLPRYVSVQLPCTQLHWFLARHKQDLSGQLGAMRALPPAESFWQPYDRRVGIAQPVWTFVGRDRCLVLWGAGP
jgi:hypothetical protein